MKTGAFMLALLWFAASTYAGYRLTERSFAWIDQPNFGMPVKESAKQEQPSSAAGTNPLESLSPQAIACLRAAIKPSRFSAVLQGDLTPQEAAAVQTCLK